MENEELILSQIKIYDESQTLLKDLIANNIESDNLELYIISDDWLNKWKKYTCFDEIRYSMPLNKNKLREVRLKNESDKIVLDMINNKDLIVFDNTNLYTNFTINMESNFHFLTKECFDILTQNKINQKEKIKFDFISYKNKLISKYKNKILILYINKNNLNFILLTLNNNNFDISFDNEICYMKIKESNIKDLLMENGINDNVEKCPITIQYEEYYFIADYLNKSFMNIKNKEKEFINLISSLIKFESNFQLLINNNKIEKIKMYLINEDWLTQFKNELNYVNILNNQKKMINLDFLINKMILQYQNNNSKYSLKNKINPNDSIFKYLMENNTGNIIKYYSNYTLIDNILWEKLIKFFYWNNEICINATFINKNIIIQYDDKNFEIIEISNNKIINNVLFCIYENYNINNIINEIKMIGVNGYYQKYNINILNNNVSTQELIDYTNNNQSIGLIVNINAAKNNMNIIPEQIDKNKLNIGLNKFNYIYNNNSNNNNNNNLHEGININNKKEEINPNTKEMLLKALEKKNKNKTININNNNMGNNEFINNNNNHIINHNMNNNMIMNNNNMNMNNNNMIMNNNNMNMNMNNNNMIIIII